MTENEKKAAVLKACLGIMIEEFGEAATGVQTSEDAALIRRVHESVRLTIGEPIPDWSDPNSLKPRDGYVAGDQCVVIGPGAITEGPGSVAIYADAPARTLVVNMDKLRAAVSLLG